MHLGPLCHCQTVYGQLSMRMTSVRELAQADLHKMWVKIKGGLTAGCPDQSFTVDSSRCQSIHFSFQEWRYSLKTWGVLPLREGGREGCSGPKSTHTSISLPCNTSPMQYFFHAILVNTSISLPCNTFPMQYSSHAILLPCNTSQHVHLPPMQYSPSLSSLHDHSCPHHYLSARSTYWSWHLSQLAGGNVESIIECKAATLRWHCNF